MAYGIRLANGAVQRVTESSVLTSEQADGLLGGGAELVWIDGKGEAQPLPLRSRHTPEGEPTMRTPLLSIRIRHSECPTLHAGQQFDTITDFDATIGAARRRVCAAPQKVAFVLTWKDGATFHGRLDVDPRRPEGLIPHVTSACREVLRVPAHEALVPGAWVTVARLFDAAMAERLTNVSRPFAEEERTWTSQTL